MADTIFIDGDQGTTGLQIRERLKNRDDFDLLILPDNERKNIVKRQEALNDADIAILCLPDVAARQAVSLIRNSTTRVIDASTAHRVSEDWVYGFPEMLPGQERLISVARWVTNPGCYPTGTIALLRPLVEAGLIPKDYPISINAVSGYTGGGRELIERMEDPLHAKTIKSSWFPYGLDLNHKHVQEMQTYSGLTRRPIFSPSVGRFRQGMVIQVPVHLRDLPERPTINAIRELLFAYYEHRKFVIVRNIECAGKRLPFLDPEDLLGTNNLRLAVFGNQEEEQALLVAELDNLGKGAAGQAVQCLNLMLGTDPLFGLN